MIEAKKKSTGWIWIVGVLLAGTLLLLTRSVWLPLPGIFLVVPDHVEKADCVVPLRGEDYYRIQKAVELMKAGFANHAVISPVSREVRRLYFNNFNLIYDLKTPPEKEVLLRYFAHFGKNAEGIDLTDGEATSTFEEALLTKKLLLKKGYRSFILVTSGYHMRRALMIFNLVFRGSGIKIYHAEGYTPIYHPDEWWRKERDVKEVGEEYVSILFNLFYHFVLKKVNTSFDNP